MKLVIVGWLIALIAFALGYIFGRRRRNTDMYRDAMYSAMGMMAISQYMKEPGRKEELENALKGTAEEDDDGD